LQRRDIPRFQALSVGQKPPPQQGIKGKAIDMTTIAFVIPVRHQDNATDWPGLKRRLAQTMQSIANQQSASWRGVVVANTGADLPDMPNGFEVCRVDFPPNPKYDINDVNRNEALDTFRFDKGRRVLMGMLQVRDSEYAMIVDDDDFVSNRLVDWIERNIDVDCCDFDVGLKWSEGVPVTFLEKNFTKVCGTSHIVRLKYYKLPETFAAASETYIKNYLGSHHQISAFVRDAGGTVRSLPFPGAIYRVGHPGAHSQSKGIVWANLLDPKLMRQPRRWLRNMRSVRVVTTSMRREFSIR
jgi:hypothetical protein